jgi:5'-3' exoribonuclease 1
MGVPSLSTFIKNNFPEAYKHFRKGTHRNQVDYFLIDANAIFHKCAQIIYNYGSEKAVVNRFAKLTEDEKQLKVFDLFFNTIRELCEITVPKKVLYIAIDGVAPIAKQAQQRQRRYVSALRNKESPVGFDSNKLTTGTEFMHEMTKYINYRIRNEMQNNIFWKHLTVYFSSHTIAGEGEQKLVNFIRTLKDNKLNNSYCFYGPDGDLIMLTLACQCPKMFLLRNDMMYADYYELYDIGMIRNELPNKLTQLYLQDMKCDDAVKCDDSDEKLTGRTINDVVNDFLVIGFFGGNDFLPKAKMFYHLHDGLNLMFDSYSLTSECGSKNYVTVDNEINIDGFRLFVEDVSMSEQQHLIQQCFKPDPRDSKYCTLGNNIDFTDNTLLSCVKKGTCPDDSDLDFTSYRRNYYKKCNINTEKGIIEMCKSYLTGMQFVFHYYTRPLKHWKWNYQYHYPPLMSDFSNFLKYHSNEELQKIMIIEETLPEVPFVQLLCILPAYSKELLPYYYHEFFNDKELYPENFEIDYEGKTKEHEGVVKLPFINTENVIRRYNKVKLPIQYTRNTWGTVKKFIYDKNYKSNFKSNYGNLININIRKEEL